MKKKYKTIIWDWNGTLLNDRDHCIESMNRLLQRRSLPNLVTSRYLDIFTFPVRNYYATLGFDFEKEPFEIPALEFIEEYNQNLSKVELHRGVVQVLEGLNQLIEKQVIISAMKHESLVASVAERGILKYFDLVAGIQDDLANGKTELAFEIFKKESIDPNTTLLVGDTLHDTEVANQLNIDCVLVAHGHQSKTRLEQSGVVVVGSLYEVIKLIL